MSRHIDYCRPSHICSLMFIISIALRQIMRGMFLPRHCTLELYQPLLEESIHYLNPLHKLPVLLVRRLLGALRLEVSFHPQQQCRLATGYRRSRPLWLLKI